MLLSWVYLFLFVSLTALALFLAIKNSQSRNRLIYWAAAIVLSGGLAGLQLLLEKNVAPYMAGQGSPELLRAVRLLVGLLNVYINSFPYYGILVFFLLYNNLLRYGRWVMTALSVPLWISMFQSNLQADRIDTKFIAAWGLVYMLASIGLAIRPIRSDPGLLLRARHATIALMFLLPELMLSGYHFAAFPYSDMLLILIPCICLASLLMFLVLYLRDAFLGMKRKQAHLVQASAGLIQHSLKNAIGKVKLNALNIEKQLQRRRHDEIAPFVRNLLATCEDMMGTMARISRATSVKMAPSLEMCDLSRLIAEAAAGLAAYPNVRVELDCRPTVLAIDRALIAECLTNVVNNAVESMKGEGTLVCRVASRGERVLLTVADSGPGMNMVQQQNVFEPFYSTKSGDRHFGLGMYHVRRVMEAHRGKVEVRSALGKGTEFRLHFKSSGRKRP